MDTNPHPPLNPLLRVGHRTIWTVAVQTNLDIRSLGGNHVRDAGLELAIHFLLDRHQKQIGPKNITLFPEIGVCYCNP